MVFPFAFCLSVIKFLSVFTDILSLLTYPAVSLFPKGSYQIPVPGCTFAASPILIQHLLVTQHPDLHQAGIHLIHWTQSNLQKIFIHFLDLQVTRFCLSRSLLYKLVSRGSGITFWDNVRRLLLTQFSIFLRLPPSALGGTHHL